MAEITFAVETITAENDCRVFAVEQRKTQVQAQMNCM